MVDDHPVPKLNPQWSREKLTKLIDHAKALLEQGLSVNGKIIGVKQAEGVGVTCINPLETE